MKRVLLVGFAVILAFGLVACGSKEESKEDTGTYVANQRETAYAYTHGGYVGKAEVVVDADGNLDVTIDEAFLPHTLAIVDIEADEWTEDNTVSYVSHGRDYYVAKYVSYNGATWVAVPTGSTFSYVEADENGAPAGGTDLEKSILRNQGTMAAYYALISAGQFAVLPAFGGTSIPVTTTSYGGLTKKNAPGYWNTGVTWMGNIEAIEEFAEENGVQYSLTDMVRAEEANDEGLQLWSVADAVTGATNSDFKDYFGLVQAAVGRLETN